MLLEHVQRRHARSTAEVVPKGTITMRDADKKHERRGSEFVRREVEVDDDEESDDGMETDEESGDEGHINAQSNLEDVDMENQDEDEGDDDENDDEYEDDDDDDEMDVVESHVEDEEVEIILDPSQERWTNVPPPHHTNHTTRT